MIFVTVGAQTPFDRLVQTVDRWAGKGAREHVFAQIGPTAWRPAHIQWTQFILPTEFEPQVRRASLLIAHAGIGSILTAMALGKPILVMPRRAALGETRNDHQLATAKHFAEYGVAVAENESELARRLDRLHELSAPAALSRQASPGLLCTLRAFIETGERLATASHPA
ncbi:MAG: hypothetical protein GY778_20485 [bacterium]|nr:hypothetical protein [bacterium]